MSQNDPKKNLELIQNFSYERASFNIETVSNYFYPGEKILYSSQVFIKASYSTHFLTLSSDVRRMIIKEDQEINSLIGFNNLL